METIFVSITGPGSADDLINGGREAVARAGFQVGDFDLTQELDGSIVGNLEVDSRLYDELRTRGVVSLEWGEYRVEASDE